MTLLSEEERRSLLTRARRAAARALGVTAPAGGSGVGFGGLRAPDDGPVTGRLAEPGMAFVTWKRDGRLRGCIGSVEPVLPLWEDVETNAVAALVRDPRFPPSTARDLPLLRLEISVLGPFERIAGPSDVEIGAHGLYVEKGRRKGLLLPQVAPEWSWRADEFLEQACLKAGLPGHSWHEPGFGVALHRFGAEVFGEELT